MWRLRLWLVHRTLLGPLMGCSCTRCFSHPWRVSYWREVGPDQVRLAELEKRVARLERRQ